MISFNRYLSKYYFGHTIKSKQLKMKNVIVILALAALTTVTILSGCQSEARRLGYELTNAPLANLELTPKASTVVSEALKNAVNMQDWKIFKKSSDFKIRDNDIRIAELKVKMQRRGKLPDPVYKEKLNDLENVNLEMKKKMVVYTGDKNEWNIYKREFNRDLDALGQILTALTVENKFSSKIPGDL